jgi:hypothetical protein
VVASTEKRRGEDILAPPFSLTYRSQVLWSRLSQKSQEYQACALHVGGAGDGQLGAVSTVHVGWLFGCFTMSDVVLM